MTSPSTPTTPTTTPPPAPSRPSDPANAALFDAIADEHGVILSTRSYTADERAEMDRMVDAFHAADTYGILRVALRWLSMASR